MLNGARQAICKKLQPVSIHGQLSWDVHFTDLEDPDGQMHVARLGPEAVASNLSPGDRVVVAYVIGIPVRVERLEPT